MVLNGLLQKDDVSGSLVPGVVKNSKDYIMLFSEECGASPIILPSKAVTHIIDQVSA